MPDIQSDHHRLVAREKNKKFTKSWNRKAHYWGHCGSKKIFKKTFKTFNENTAHPSCTPLPCRVQKEQPPIADSQIGQNKMQYDKVKALVLMLDNATQ